MDLSSEVDWRGRERVLWLIARAVVEPARRCRGEIRNNKLRCWFRFDLCVAFVNGLFIRDIALNITREWGLFRRMLLRLIFIGACLSGSVEIH